jgi:ribosome-binding protein aMBF1 (putative translation factor)
MDKHFNIIDKRSLDHQDWNQVIINTKLSKEEETKVTSKLSDRQQKELKLFKKDEEGDFKHEKVPQDIRKKIQGKRCELKWTQKELAQKCNLLVSIINDIETGKSVYNHNHINKIRRILKI